METPWLIQRMRFKTPPTGLTFDGLLQMDYMGAAEYEFGALPASLKLMCAGADGLVIKGPSGIKDIKGKPLFIIAMTDEDAKAYEKFLFAMVATDMGKPGVQIRLKEPLLIGRNITGLEFGNRPIPDEDMKWRLFNAWWDIRNQVIFVFGAGSAESIVAAIRMTRDQKKADGKKGWF